MIILKRINFILVIFSFLGLCHTERTLADSCVLQVNQAVVDYGALNPDVLRAAAKTSNSLSLGKRNLQLYVFCSSARGIAIAFHGLELDAASYKLSDKGSFDLVVKNGELDGEPVSIGEVSSVGDVSGVYPGVLRLMPGKFVAPIDGQVIKHGKVLSLTLELEARLIADRLRVRDASTLDGKGYFILKEY